MFQILFHLNQVQEDQFDQKKSLDSQNRIRKVIYN